MYANDIWRRDGRLTNRDKELMYLTRADAFNLLDKCQSIIERDLDEIDDENYRHWLFKWKRSIVETRKNLSLDRDHIYLMWLTRYKIVNKCLNSKQYRRKLGHIVMPFFIKSPCDMPVGFLNNWASLRYNVVENKFEMIPLTEKDERYIRNSYIFFKLITDDAEACERVYTYNVLSGDRVRPNDRKNIREISRMVKPIRDIFDMLSWYIPEDVPLHLKSKCMMQRPLTKPERDLLDEYFNQNKTFVVQNRPNEWVIGKGCVNIGERCINEMNETLERLFKSGTLKACPDCNRIVVYDVDDKRKYRAKNLPIPDKCPSCRRKRKTPKK